jgi:NAD(P)-dependent dehydrogenase (short-subunit alcohol dehydrogenase family)
MQNHGDSAVIFGGYGTFGRHVAAELARRNVRVTVAGRSYEKAAVVARQLGPPHRAIQADVTDRQSCLTALKDHNAAVHCAGPFSQFDTTLIEACLDARCHYVDIADDRQYAAKVRQFGARFEQLNLTAAYGSSSLPSISCAAAVAAREGTTADVRRVRCTLFIGNANPKGRAAVASAAGLLGRRIAAPQGDLRGFRDRELVPLPKPFGPHWALNLESPDYDLLPQLVGAQSVVVKVGFEFRTVTAAFGLLAALAPRLGRWLLPRLARPAGLLRGLGSTGGVVMAELFLSDGTSRRGAVVARRDGQRLAALPAVYVAERLCAGASCRRGALTACEVLGARQLIDLLAGDGYEVDISAGATANP